MQPLPPAAPRPRWPRLRSASCVATLNLGCMKASVPSQEIVPVALVTDSRGALIACCIDMPWSIRFSVTLNTELMMVAPPGEP